VYIESYYIAELKIANREASLSISEFKIAN